MKDFFKDFSSLDAILTDQIIRYRASFKLLLIILIVSLLASISTSVYLLSMLRSSMEVTNKRSYIVLNDSGYVIAKGNSNIEYYLESISKDLSRNLLSINPDSKIYNVDYMKAYSSYNEVITGYYNWLNERVLYLNTIRGIQIFSPKTVIHEIDAEQLSKNGMIKATVRVDGDMYTISELKPKIVGYTIFIKFTIDGSTMQYNQHGINIDLIQIHLTESLKKS
jgi:predicted transcriptional regulator